jgi:hypothetical protein
MGKGCQGHRAFITVCLRTGSAREPQVSEVALHDHVIDQAGMVFTSIIDKNARTDRHRTAEQAVLIPLEVADQQTGDRADRPGARLRRPGGSPELGTRLNTRAQAGRCAG